MSDDSSVRARASLWDRVPLVIRAIVIGVLVMGVGVQAWAVLGQVALRLKQPLVPLVLMPIVLVVYWLFFSGAIFWRATKTVRRENFRETSLSPATWGWGLAGAALFVVAFQASVFTLFRLFAYPPEQFARPDVVALIPSALLWPYVIVASLVAGICEETGFRGYMQRPLEKRYGPATGIAVVTLMFMLAHLNQAWLTALLLPSVMASVMLGILATASRSLIPSMIGHAVMDLFNFSYWWWHLLGHYNQRPVFETGLDLNFIAWAVTLAISLSLFVLVTRKLGSARAAAGRFQLARPVES
jgi:membrane protease YdiL (CAAX protease family)